MLRQAEHRSALANADGTGFACPRVHILKDVGMDLLEMRQIEPARDRCQSQLLDTVAREVSFELAQGRLGTDTQEVLENRSPGNQVGIICHVTPASFPARLSNEHVHACARSFLPSSVRLAPTPHRQLALRWKGSTPQWQAARARSRRRHGATPLPAGAGFAHRAEAVCQQRFCGENLRPF